MTRRKGSVEEAWAATAKTLRAAIRLKHSIAADKELNGVLPEVKRRFDRDVLQGRLPQSIDVQKILSVKN